MKKLLASLVVVLFIGSYAVSVSANTEKGISYGINKDNPPQKDKKSESTATKKECSKDKQCTGSADKKCCAGKKSGTASTSSAGCCKDKSKETSSSK